MTLLQVDTPTAPRLAPRPDGVRHGLGHGTGHRLDHGFAAARQGRRRLGRQRHHPPGRRRPRRRRSSAACSILYGSKIGDFFAGTEAPAEAVTAAKGSIGGAFGVAAELPQQLSSTLISTANQAFVEAIHWGVVVAALATAVGAFVVWFFPARARQHDVREQEAEYQDEWADVPEPRDGSLRVQHRATGMAPGEIKP